MATPKLKIYSPEGEYVASCKYADDAINLALRRGINAEVRYGHKKQFCVYRITETEQDGDGNTFIDDQLLYDRVDEIQDNASCPLLATLLYAPRRGDNPYTYKPMLHYRTKEDLV